MIPPQETQACGLTSLAQPLLAGGGRAPRNHPQVLAFDLSWKVFGVCLLALLVVPALGAETVEAADGESLSAEEVIARCVAALGGEAAWRAIETLELTGRHTSFSQTQDFLLRRKRPDLYYFDHNETTFRVTTAYDGETAWWHTGIPLISKANWPVDMPRVYQSAVAAEAELEPPVIDHRAKGHEIEWAGESRFEGEAYLELRIKRRQDPDNVERWFLDPESFLPTLRLSRGAYHGYTTEQLTYFDDYRQVAGVQLPHRVETELGNDFLELVVDSVKVNHEIDDSVFHRPPPAGMELLRTLAGRWRVSIESLDNPVLHPERQRQWTTDETVAVIHSRAGGSLLEEEIEVATDRPRRARRLFSYDRFREVYRLAHFDTYSQHLDVLEGQLADGRLVLTNLRTDTPVRILRLSFHAREILHDIQPDSFKLDREVSPDGGQSWVPDIRFVYTRIPEDD